MTITNTSLLNAYAGIAEQTYLDTPPFDTGPTPLVSGPNGTNVEMTQVVDGPLGFQAKAYFNTTRDELVIVFAGTEGLRPNNVDPTEFVPDMLETASA